MAALAQKFSYSVDRKDLAFSAAPSCMHAEKAEIVASVCTGASLLAKAGRLDGRRATSNTLSFKWPTEQGPRMNWVHEARWVDDGEFSTSSGVSAGIAMPLLIIARITDVKTAENIAVGMEYEWHRDAGWDALRRSTGISRGLTRTFRQRSVAPEEGV